MQTKIDINIPKTSRARSVVPGHVFRQVHFKWVPPAFAVEYEKFEGKLVTEKPQYDSLTTFAANPSMKGIYSVSGNPDDMMAKYFAGYLVHLHMAANPNAHVVWQPIYGGFDNKLIENPIQGITMLVLTNLTPNATAVKLEKARDLLEFYADIPRVVVSAGTDPMTFMCGKLYLPINALAYFQGRSLNTEVI